ncbi:MAG TPA: alpha/beta fold hydrolase [Acidimicrobiales bacterium]|nr:alpha/beta fold hydrolase [Acidimicrobiales bacterium]
MESLTVENNGVRLRVNLQGEGPTILLLHGWPDTSALWDEVAPQLANAGYRVASPDLRGCGQSDKPSDVASYKMRHLVGDVASIIGAIGEEKVTLVGHDWGANLAWAVAAYHPELVERLCVVSVGHPTAFCSAGLEQQVKSWYTLLFYIEGLGEAFLRKDDYEVMRRWLGHPRAQDVIEELERDGQMTTHLMWYRANLAPDAFIAPPPTLPSIDVPVLGLWSSGDVALGERQMTNSASYCTKGFTFVRFEGQGHWLPLEAPRELSHEVVEFCSASH